MGPKSKARCSVRTMSKVEEAPPSSGARTPVATPAARVTTPNSTRRPAPFPIEFYRSAIAKKWIMALTGIMLLGFVLFHMIGNLKIYLGQEDIDHYGEWLRTIATPA